ncbi:MAG: hypothetical protein HPY45_07405 [Anaerolineae bacterium]|nr:hypothetical protein [Anaerolineae bacterium]
MLQKTIRFLRLIFRHLREKGFYQTLTAISNGLNDSLQPPPEVMPLQRAKKDILFTTNEQEVRARIKQAERETAHYYTAAETEKTYPFVFGLEGKEIRYAYLPARQSSRGIIVHFHGHFADRHPAPTQPREHFDLLAPWDIFGAHRMGSFFWGEKGDNFTDRIVSALIQHILAQNPGKPWFCQGASMGGFAAIYHGIKSQCDGIYAGMPQINLRAKVVEYHYSRNNPYGYLMGDTLDSVPDIFEIAEAQDTLPPLFFMTNQYDLTNPFATHGFRLLDIYNRKKAWYGVRVYPGISHQCDYSESEAEYFFSLIVEKMPPHQTPFEFQ